MSKKQSRKRPIKTVHRRKVIHLIVKKKHSVAKPTAEASTAVKQETKALMVVEQPKTVLPNKVEEPKKEAPAETRSIEIPDVYVDGAATHTETELPKTEKRYDIDRIFRAIGTAIICIVILSFIIVFFLSIEPNEEKTVTRTTI